MSEELQEATSTSIVDDRHPRQCTAHRSNGKPCKRYAIVGHHVCTSHGGASPQVIKIAKERIGKLADSAVDVLEEAIQGDDPARALKASKIVLDRTGIGPKSTIEIEQPPSGAEADAGLLMSVSRFLTDAEGERYLLLVYLAEMRHKAVIAAGRMEEFKALKAGDKSREAMTLAMGCFATHGELDIPESMLAVLEDQGITTNMILAMAVGQRLIEVRPEPIIAEPEPEPDPDEPTTDSDEPTTDSARAAIAKHFLGRDVDTPVATDEEPVTIELEPPVRGADQFAQPDGQPNPTGFRNLLGWRK